MTPQQLAYEWMLRFGWKHPHEAMVFATLRTVLDAAAVTDRDPLDEATVVSIEAEMKDALRDAVASSELAADLDRRWQSIVDGLRAEMVTRELRAADYREERESATPATQNDLRRQRAIIEDLHQDIRELRKRIGSERLRNDDATAGDLLAIYRLAHDVEPPRSLFHVATDLLARGTTFRELERSVLIHTDVNLIAMGQQSRSTPPLQRSDVKAALARGLSISQIAICADVSEDEVAAWIAPPKPQKSEEQAPVATGAPKRTWSRWTPTSGFWNRSGPNGGLRRWG